MENTAQPELDFSQPQPVGKAKVGRPAKSLQQRFWERVNKDGPKPDQSVPAYVGLDKCWLWTGALDQDGYGRIGIGGSKCLTLRAHRCSFELHGGVLPEGHVAMHKCDNPTCVNPSHIQPGTIEENNKDAKTKSRTASGAKHWMSKTPELIKRGSNHHNSQLTDDDVRAIRASSEPGWVLAARYGLKNRNSPNLIRSGRSWKHVK